MEWITGKPRAVSRLGLFPGAFNPPTRAHLEVARSALAEVDAVAFVIPRRFPHKDYEHATLAQRLNMLRAALAAEPRFSVAVSEGGLFRDIARECRNLCGDVPLAFLCGRDAAERIVAWDYGAPSVFGAMLAEFELLVADRQGAFAPPEDHRRRIRRLAVPPGLEAVSASEVRRRIAAGEPWQDLVPAPIVDLVGAIYPP